jgi:hypothetical protein
MKVAVFSNKNCDRVFLQAANARHGHELFFSSRASLTVLAQRSVELQIATNQQSGPFDNR